MSTVTFEVNAEIRQDIGKGASRRLRHTNAVPAVVYGGGESPVSLTLSHDKIWHALSHEGFYSHILTLKIGADKSEKVILKAVQRHPAKPRIAHIDFLRVRADQKLHMHVPLHFIGAEEAPGIKEGGVFSHNISDVEVSCFPADLPEFITVDVSQFGLNDVLHLSQLKLPAKVELVAFAHGVEDHDLPVVSLHIPRIEEETSAETTEEATAGEENAEATPAAEAKPDQSTAPTEKK